MATLPRLGRGPGRRRPGRERRHRRGGPGGRARQLPGRSAGLEADQERQRLLPPALSRHKEGKKGHGKGSSFGPVPGKGKGSGKQGKDRGITIQELKLRTRCRSCGRIGHWSKECPTNSSSRPSSSAASSSSAPSTASAQGTSFYWAGRDSGPVTEFFTESVPDAKVSFLTSDHSSADVPFVGVITSSAEAIVDTAAQEGLIGRPALLRLFEALRKFGLKGRWMGEASEARGIGGAAKTLGVVEVPVGIGRVPGVVALTVVTEDVPFLLPVNLLRALKASVDLGENRLHLRAVNTDCVMNVLPSGHPTVSVLDFGHGWFLPEICRGHVPESAFRSSPKQVQFSTGPHDHILSSSAQATLATFIGGPDVRCSSSPCSRAAMCRDHPRAQPATRTRALARALGQALVCSSVGTLSINNKPVVAAPFADTFDHVNFGQHQHLDYSGAGRHGQGASIPQLLGEQEAHGHDAGEGDTRAGAEQVQARGPLPERRVRSQELVPLQEQVEPVAKDSSHHDREAPSSRTRLQLQLPRPSLRRRRRPPCFRGSSKSSRRRRTGPSRSFIEGILPAAGLGQLAVACQGPLLFLWREYSHLCPGPLHPHLMLAALVEGGGPPLHVRSLEEWPLGVRENLLL